MPKIAIFSSKQELIDVKVTSEDKVAITVFRYKKPFIKTYLFDAEPENLEVIREKFAKLNKTHQ
jgi:hypothetical protein